MKPQFEAVGYARTRIRYLAGVAAAMAAVLAGIVPDSSAVTRGEAESATLSQPSSPFTRFSDPSGCRVEQLTDAGHDEYQVLSVSRDGRWLMMTARRAGAKEGDDVHQVQELDLVTGARKDLTPDLTNAGPFSPDGRFNALAQLTDNGKTDLFEYERATGDLRALTSHEEWDWLPSYSPDGRFIVFNSYRFEGQSDILLLERSTGALRRLTNDPGYDAHAQFSPDGRKILFHRQRGTRDGGGYVFDLMVHDLELGTEIRLTDGDFEESYAAWAPDGRHLVFSSDGDSAAGKLNLYVLSPDGKAAARLTQGNWKDSYAFWTHDGQFIYFNSDRAGTTNIYRMRMHGLECFGKAGDDR